LHAPAHLLAQVAAVLHGLDGMLSAALKFVAYAWLTVLVFSTVSLGLIYLFHLAARVMRRIRR
jgi:hypothetical protein